MNFHIQSIFRIGGYFPQAKQTQYISLLTLLMLGHLWLPYNFYQTNALTNIDVAVESFSVQQALHQSSYEVFAKGVCSVDCPEVNSYFYKFGSLTIQLEIDHELKSFSGDILMHEPNTTYQGNYFSFQDSLLSDAMVISQNIASKVKESISLKFISQGNIIADYTNITDEMSYPHYGFYSTFFNETHGLFVIGYNDFLYQSLSAREKVSRMVFSTHDDQNLAQVFNLEEISFKYYVFEGFIRENQQDPQFTQILNVQFSIFFWVFVMGWFLAVVGYYWFYYGIYKWSFNKSKVLYYSWKFNQSSIFLIESIGVLKSWLPSALSLLICFLGYSLILKTFSFSILIAFLFFILFQLITLLVIVLLGNRFHFGKIIKGKQ